MIFRVVATLRLKSDAQVEITCDVGNKICQLVGVILQLFDDLFEQFDDCKQVHIAVELVAVVGVLDKFGAHEVEQCRNLNVNVQNKLQGAIYVAAVVRLRLDDEKLLFGKVKPQQLKHCAQIDVVVRAALELRCDVDGFAEREAVNVVHIGVLCKFVTAEDVCARVGERDVEILDCKRKFERHIVLAAVCDVRLVCRRACNVLVNRNRRFAVFEHREFVVGKFFATVALAVVDNFAQIRNVYALVNHHFVLGVAFGFVVVWSDRTHIVAVFALDVVAVCVLSEDVIGRAGIVDLVCKVLFVGVASCVVGIFVVSVAVETERNVKRKIDAVRCVELHLDACVEFVIEQLLEVESEQIFGDIFDDCVKEFVAELQGEQISVDKHRQSEVFVAEVDVACVRSACHKRFACG